ncbi:MULTISPECIES: hypothetical protein [Corynebacterium]|uniref:hypothetical protein n=1 Tax=Corynebacterium TaxID=1716 RepID=UPI0008D8DC26|nr:MULTISPECIES: hypothetical protein [Corynebacterium]MDK8245006.1 hypothetical protein [Corynebacterium sp. UMB10321]MDK8307296.1 hypothetical protein [Corynebacterium imitans]MDK8636221.1 hypothetical protein [Corynebacterium imitans]MDK8771419.1 hypothetical protein [Corynebacterium imitans]
MSVASPNPEVGFNVWVFYSEGGLSATYAVKPYAFNGDAESMRAMMKALAPTDFYTVPQRTYPKRFQLHGPNGQVLEGAVTVASVDDKVVEQLVESVLPLPPQYVNRQGVPGDFQLPVDTFNFVVTFVEEREDGTLLPQVSA